MKHTTRIVVATGAALAVAVVGGTAAFGGQSSGSHPNGVQPQKAQALVSTPSGGSEMSYVPVTPCRLVNTAKVHHKLAAGTSRNFYVSGTTGFEGQGGRSGGCGIPASAVAVSLTLTAHGAKGQNGSLVAYAVGGSPHGTTTLAYTQDHPVSTGTTVALGTGTGKRLTIRTLHKATDLTVDVAGYYAQPLTAFIALDGSLQYGTGRVLASSHTSTGNYLVTFDRDVSQCSFEVTPYAYNWTVAVGPELGHADQAHVFIHDQGTSTTAHDTSFFIAAFC